MLQLNSKARGEKSICVGAGLVTLDLIMEEQKKTPGRAYSGGSCGNVLTILSFLGWRSFPIARLGQDEAAKVVKKDMARFGVSSKYLIEEPCGRTPIIIQMSRLGRNGRRTHSFSWSCPHCGSQLPRHRKLQNTLASEIQDDLPGASVFYFDRVSEGTLSLAQYYREMGALIVFEPSGLGKENHLRKAISLTHILKYSRQRISGLTASLGNIFVPLEIETLGEKGLRYRKRENARILGKWRHLPAYEVSCLADEAGSGDWCTAGIILSLGDKAEKSLRFMGNTSVSRALDIGQAFAAINCCFPGARGAMYTLSSGEVMDFVLGTIRGKQVPKKPKMKNPATLPKLLRTICTSCRSLDNLTT